MKKILHFVLILCLLFFFAGCGQKEAGADDIPDASLQSQSGDAAERLPEESSVGSEGYAKTAPAENSAADLAPAVMVDGKLYFDTGRESALTARCGNMDGEITSSVDETKIPSENDQSNFGSGYGYQYGESGTIEVLLDGRWFVFEQRLTEYTFDDSVRDVTFSIEYPDGWKLTELPAHDGDERRDASPSTGIRFTFFGDEEEMFSIMASLISPFGVDETMFDSEPFVTDAGLAGVKYTREAEGRVWTYYIFGDEQTLPQYLAVVIMNPANYEKEINGIEDVLRTLKIPSE